MDILIGLIAVCLIVLAVVAYRLFRRVQEQENRLADLTRRVYALEPREVSVQEPVMEAASVPPPLPVVPQPRPREDWEAVVGTNWLNRVGALVLVIGIALLLGFSLTQLGPAGKVAIGFLAGLSMLLMGIALRANERYGVFAVSLAGGGWAAIYFTAYAAHALEPARLITSVAAALTLLLAVSVCMIVHALWYVSERGVALAFVFSFITLNVTPLTTFSISAAIVLSIALLALAHARQWFRLALAGVALAYLTFLLRHDGQSSTAQAALWIQWLAFEGYDILDLRRRGFQRGIERTVFPLNACGFIGASLIYSWNHLGWFLFASAAAYLASALLRARFGPGPGHVTEGGYEGALLASSALTAAALVERFTGTSITLALLIEGEMLVLAGDALANGFVRGIGGAVLSTAIFHLLFVDALVGKPTRSWTPIGTLVAAALLFNRLRGGWYYAAGGGVVLAAITAAELPAEWIPLAWAALGLGALYLAERFDLKDARWLHRSWALANLCAGLAAIPQGGKARVPVILTAACFYIWQYLARNDRPLVPGFYSLLGTILLTSELFAEVQGRLLTVALGLEGSGLLIVGFVTQSRVLRLSGLAVFLLCIGKAFLYDLRQLDTFGRILSFIALGLLLLGASWVYTRFREKIRRLL